MPLYNKVLPIDTSRNVQKLLSESGILTISEDWREVSSHLQLVDIRTLDSYPMESHGKGTSKALALASAYGEFMERLQGECFLGQTFGCMPPAEPSADQAIFKYNELSKTQLDVISHLSRVPTKEIQFPEDFPIECKPFYNVTEDRVDYLPHRMMELCCRSNGLCAGNSQEEALIQGICEILERFVKKTIFENHIESPTIPLHAIENETTSVALIQELKEKGYQVILKDLSLGGLYPVVGTVLLHGGTRRYMFNTGSDPWFSVAINRSLAEMFQKSEGFSKCSRPVMLSDLSDPKRIEPIDDKQKRLLISQLISGVGQQVCPEYFLLSSGKVKISEACDNPPDNRTALRDLIARIHKNGYQIYVRDVSYLGFPALWVYIPGVSELMPFSTGLLDLYRNKHEIRKAILHLSSCTDDQFKMLLQILERAYDESLFQYPADLISVTSNLSLRSDSDFNQFKIPEVLLMLLSVRTGNYAKAHHYLSYLFEKELLSNLESQGAYYLGTLAYYKMRSENRPLAEIESVISNMVGIDVAKEVMADQHDPTKVFQYMKLPYCGDCDQCPVVDECYYQKWKTISSKLGEKRNAHPIQQQDLAKLFDGLLLTS